MPPRRRRLEFIEAEHRRRRESPLTRAPATISRRPPSSCRGPIRRRAEDRGRGGDGRCGKWHVIRRRPSRGGGGGGGGHRVEVGKKSKKKKKRAGAGAAAAAAAAAGGERCLPDAVLSQLAKKQTEPTFPDVSAWCVGSAQATGSEATAAAAATAPVAPGAVVVVPVRTLRLRVDLRSRRVGKTAPSPRARG